MTSTRPGLPVPAESVDRLWGFFDDRDPMNAADWVRAIAAPVVAAVLREEADRLDAGSGNEYLDAFLHRGAYNAPLAAIAERLRERAAQISG